jgi:predicted ATPase
MEPTAVEFHPADCLPMSTALSIVGNPQERTNLPLQLTSFIGRRVEIDQAKQLMSECRLMTLTGAGGIGKTRLAVEIGRQLLGAYTDGVWLVELAGLRDANLVPDAVASALGFTIQKGATPTESLVDFLETRELLCILDNCEHLIEGAAQVANRLLRRCPGLRILATSRDVLGVDGEVVWRVPSMPTLDARRSHTMDELQQCDTVQLLVQRAQAARPGFELNSDNAPSVVRVCQTVDGIPLAIELVAARTRSMSVSAIEERITEQFTLVTGGRRLSMPRQRTLWATFDWSHELLTDEEKTVFRRLSIFAGSFTLDAAEAVCGSTEGDVHDQSHLVTLTGLADKSLMISLEGAYGADRYRLLEPIRQYAAERLGQAGESDDIRGRHARYFLDLGENAFDELRGPRQRAWMERVTNELDNLRACFTWALDHEPRAALRLAVALDRHWIRNSPAEGRVWLKKILERYGDRDELRAHALYDAAYWAWYRGDAAEGRELATECLAVAEEIKSELFIGQALVALGTIASTERAEGWLADSIATFATAERHIRAADDPEALGRLLNNYGCTLQACGDFGGARTKLEEALALASSREDSSQIAAFLGSLAEIEFACDETRSAGEHWKQALAMERELGGSINAAYALFGLAQLASADQPNLSLRLLGAAGALLRTAGVDQYAKTVDAAQSQSRALLGDDVSDALLREGAAMSLQEAVRFGLGEVAPAEGATAQTGQRPIAEGVGSENAFLREGEFWSLTYAGAVARLRDSKGVRDIARLLRTPGREVAAIDLSAREVAGIPRSRSTLGEISLGIEGDVGAALDIEARGQYRTRLADLEEDISEAEINNDPERANLAREEREFLLAELGAAFGLGGRARRLLDPAERARKAVTGRIRDALTHIEAAHPDLGRHLRRSVRTGSFCAYDPAEPTRWQL